MKKYLAICALLLAAGIFSGCCKTDKVNLPKGVDVKAVRETGAGWLEKLDKGWYNQCYDESSSYLKTQITIDNWMNNMNSFRKPLGPASKRKELNMFFETELPNSPQGEYVIIQYGTVILEKQAIIETLALMKEADGSWKISGYFIK